MPIQAPPNALTPSRNAIAVRIIMSKVMSNNWYKNWSLSKIISHFLLFQILGVCGFRLDFEQFATRGPTTEAETDNAHACSDPLKISSTTVSIFFHEKMMSIEAMEFYLKEEIIKIW